MVPHSFTVAGAAQVFHLLPVSPWPKKIDAGTTNRGGIVAKAGFLDRSRNFHDTFAMNNDFDTLEQKVDQVLTLCDHLYAENLALLARVQALETEKQALAEKMETARVRLAELADKLPETV